MKSTNGFCSMFRRNLFCIEPAEQGEKRLIADNHKVLERVNILIKECLIQNKVMYVGNYDELIYPGKVFYRLLPFIGKRKIVVDIADSYFLNTF